MYTYQRRDPRQDSPSNGMYGLVKSSSSQHVNIRSYFIPGIAGDGGWLLVEKNILLYLISSHVSVMHTDSVQPMLLQYLSTACTILVLGF
jgi:hypothetical protein